MSNSRRLSMPRGHMAVGMLVTVGDLLDDPALELQAVSVAPAAMGVPVSWIHATEQLDPRPHLRPSELVCTLGSALVRPRTAKTFVAAVADAGAAGICLGLGEVHLVPPSELIEECALAGVPLLQMPHGIPFLAVNDSVRRRLSKVETEVRETEAGLLGSLLDSARDGAGADELIGMVEEALGGSFGRSRTPGSNGVSLSGTHLVWAGEGPGPSEVFLHQFSSVLDFASREREREQSEQQQQLGQLFDLIAQRLAHPAAVHPELESSQLGQLNLLVSSWPKGSEGAISSNWARALIGTTGRDVIAVSSFEALSSISEPGLVCGYSGVTQLAGLGGAIREARAALQLARNRGGVVGPEQLVSFDALLEQQSPDRLNPFVEQLLMPLVRADEESRGDLVRTLTVFIDSDRHLQETADRLFMHVNTVRHRLTRVHELSGRSPLTLAGITDLKVALWAAERRRIVGNRLIHPLG